MNEEGRRQNEEKLQVAKGRFLSRELEAGFSPFFTGLL